MVHSVARVELEHASPRLELRQVGGARRIPIREKRLEAGLGKNDAVERVPDGYPLGSTYVEVEVDVTVHVIRGRRPRGRNEHVRDSLAHAGFDRVDHPFDFVQYVVDQTVEFRIELRVSDENIRPRVLHSVERFPQGHARGVRLRRGVDVRVDRDRPAPVQDLAFRKPGGQVVERPELELWMGGQVVLERERPTIEILAEYFFAHVDVFAIGHRSVSVGAGTTFRWSSSTERSPPTQNPERYAPPTRLRAQRGEGDPPRERRWDRRSRSTRAPRRPRGIGFPASRRAARGD